VSGREREAWAIVSMRRRVTVTGPRRRPVAPRPGPGPVADDVRSVMRVQGRIALVTCTIVVVAVVGLPLLFACVPCLSRMRLLGFRLPWLVLCALPPPLWIVIAGRHVRRAERVERRVMESRRR
jgi:hypothetical protein